MIWCRLLPIHQVNEVFRLTTPTDIEQIHLTLQLNSSPPIIVVPKDIFANHRATKSIELRQFFYDARIILQIHPEAFRSSVNVTQQFTIGLSNMKMSNFSFLVGFNRLQELIIEDSGNVDMSTLPTLPSLKRLTILKCTGLKGWTIFPILIKGLEYVDIQGNVLNDDEVDRILDWILNSPSQFTLNYLDLSRNSLTRIPHQLKSFYRLETIFIHQQLPPAGFPFLSNLSLSRSVRHLKLSFCKIANIELGTFPSGF